MTTTSTPKILRHSSITSNPPHSSTPAIRLKNFTLRLTGHSEFRIKRSAPSGEYMEKVYRDEALKEHEKKRERRRLNSNEYDRESRPKLNLHITMNTKISLLSALGQPSVIVE